MIETKTKSDLSDIPAKVARTPHADAEKIMSTRHKRLGHLFLFFLLAPFSAGVANAQLSAPVIRGDMGLQAGSQPPPGVYVTGVLYNYDTHTIVDQNGNHFSRVGIDAYLAAVGVTYVAKKKVLGGNYSATGIFPLADTAINSPFAASNTGTAYSDTYVQPIQLGWHKKRYDAMAWYGLYMPTGRFTDGASNNTGFGMWSHEFGGAATFFLNEKKEWHVAIAPTYNIQSHIKDTNKKVGNILSLEGGVGRTLCSHLCNVGVDYYTQWKVTQDKFANLPTGFLGKHRYYGLGPEVNGTIPLNKDTITVFKLAFFHEFGNRSATLGNSIIMSVTWAKLKHE